MKLYWSSRQVAGLQGCTAKERRQVKWQAGLKPYRHWQVWAGLLLASLLMLLGLGYAFMGLLSASLPDAGFWLMLIASLLLPPLFFRQFHLRFLCAYVPQVRFDASASGMGVWLRSASISAFHVLLFVVAMFGIDWGINSFDESPDPRIEARKNWPDLIPDAENGFLYAIGMDVATGVSPHEAGRNYIATTNEASRAHGKQYPASPAGLAYVNYAGTDESGKPTKPNASSAFCKANIEDCWKKLNQENKQVVEWLAANRELLARYKTLQQYPQWQDAQSHDSPEAPIPSFQRLFHGQNLLMAEAMQAITRGKTAEGLALIEADVRFVRRMLEGINGLVPKMIANVMLTRDLAWLLQTLQAHPEIAKTYQGRLFAMAQPLTATQVSVANSFRFEEKRNLGWFSHDYFDTIPLLNSLADREMLNLDMLPASLQRIVELWLNHHHKMNATANDVVTLWDSMIQSVDVQSANVTSPLAGNTVWHATVDTVMGGTWYHNQAGKLMLMAGMPAYEEYANKLFDLNALNTLVRLKLTLVEQGIKPDGVPEFLSKSDSSLWNPETGKPFEWDDKNKQIFFVPAQAQLKSNIGGIAGRVGVFVHGG